MADNYLLNMAPVTFAARQITVDVLPYIDREELRRLRTNFGDYIFRRSGEEVIAIPVVQSPRPTGGRTRELLLGDSLEVTAALIREALLRHLHSIGRRITFYSPLTFVADAKLDLLAEVAEDAPSWLVVRPTYQLDVRVVRFDDVSPSIALFVNVKTSRFVDADCAELIKSGFNPTGLFVSRLLQLSDSRIVRRPQVLGKVVRVGKELLLEQARDGFESVSTDSVYVDPDGHGFPALMQFAFGNRAQRVDADLRKAMLKYTTGEGRLRTIKSVAKYFASLSLELAPGVPFKIHEIATNHEISGAVQAAPAPVYVFGPSGAQNAQVNYIGIDKFGPFSRQTFTPTRPRVCVICQRRRKGRVEEFVHKLLNGVACDKSPFLTGLIGKYRLTGCTPEFFVTEDASAAGYRNAALNAVSEATAQDLRWDLALVEIEERFRALPAALNPYYVTKCSFLSHAIPVQEFEAETASMMGVQLAYTLNNMALATYAKLGGVPWLLQANQTIAHELVIGLGSANVGGNKTGGRERVVGITTVFSGDGNYRIANLSRAVSMDDYRSALLESLQTTIERLRTQLNWQKGEHVRLIFHAFKPMKNDEACAVIDLMSSLTELDIEYAFIHVEQEHPFTIFDLDQRGVGQRNKGAMTPVRGKFLRLSERELLLTVTGPKEIKRVEHGMPRPLLLRVHRASNFIDSTYLARQAYAFSSHSWRSFFMADMPVTILYSQLIARLLGNLAQVPNWNPDVMVSRIANTRWFL